VISAPGNVASFEVKQAARFSRLKLLGDAGWAKSFNNRPARVWQGAWRGPGADLHAIPSGHRVHFPMTRLPLRVL